MQLGSFKSLVGGFLNQLGFGTWPSSTAVVVTPTLTVRIATVMSRQAEKTVSRGHIYTVSRGHLYTVKGRP